MLSIEVSARCWWRRAVAGAWSKRIVERERWTVATSRARMMAVAACWFVVLKSMLTISSVSGCESLKSMAVMNPWSEMAMCAIESDASAVRARRWSGVRIGIVSRFCALNALRAERA